MPVRTKCRDCGRVFLAPKWSNPERRLIRCPSCRQHDTGARILKVLSDDDPISAKELSVIIYRSGRWASRIYTNIYNLRAKGYKVVNSHHQGYTLERSDESEDQSDKTGN